MQKSKLAIRLRVIYLLLFSLKLCLISYGQTIKSEGQPSLMILGTIQDAGSPHIGCRKSCCKSLFVTPDPNRKVVCLGIVDPESGKKFLVEATPDITEQTKKLWKHSGSAGNEIPDAIFLTHAHIGHYTGLMYLGREGYNTKNIPVYTMPKMRIFLETNGPWDQLVKINNIELREMQAEVPVTLTPNLTIIPFSVPHRGEYSETIGFVISGKNKKVLFIPDIDKWHLWEKSIIDEIAKVDYAFLDATFYDSSEVNNRNISEIPHPFVEESFSLFDNLSLKEKSKIHFIHFNHTNPALEAESLKAKLIISKGYKIAKYGEIINL